MTPTVFIIDDDAAVRDSLSQLLTAQNFVVRTFANAEDFLAACSPSDGGCVLLDVRLPGMSGTELQAALAARGVTLPITFLTAYGDVPTSVKALKHGALDFLEKPVSAQTLLEHVQAALVLDEMQHRARAVHDEAKARIAKLTPREREVMRLASAGQSSKEIARALKISHRTVDVHRARIMQKTGVDNLVELANLARDGSAEPTNAKPPGPET